MSISIPPLYFIRSTTVNISFVKIFAWHWRKIYFMFVAGPIQYAMGPVAFCFPFKRILICYISRYYSIVLTRGPSTTPILCKSSCSSEFRKTASVLCSIFYDGNTNRDYKWDLLAWLWHNSKCFVLNYKYRYRNVYPA